MRILRRSACRRMAWKNGQGVTDEVAAFPDGTGAGDFDWRVSIAHIGGDGPFSAFPGIDRSIALIGGAGLRLDLPDGGCVALGPRDAPFSFPGEWAIGGRNVAGPTVALNVMTRRSRSRHSLDRLQLDTQRRLGFSKAGIALLVVNGKARLTAGGTTHDLERFDTVMPDRGEDVLLAPLQPCEVLVAQLFASPATDP